MIKSSLSIFVALLAAAVPLKSYGLEAKLVGDALIAGQSGYTSTNYGTYGYLTVSNSSGGRRSYVQFDLGILPTGTTSAQIAKATLRLYVRMVTTAGHFQVEHVIPSWSEDTVKWSTSPFVSSVALGNVIDVNVQASDEGKYIEVDVTNYVQSWVSGGTTNNGFALVAPTGSTVLVAFDTKEYASGSHPAALHIALAGPAGQQGIQGIQGPQGIQGLTGAAGTNGTNGTNGINGTNGTNGAKGDTGPAGPATVRIKAGDLSMGTFTQGTPP